MEKAIFKTHSPDDLTPEQLTLLPSKEEVDAFQRLGWHKTPVVIPRDLIDRAFNVGHDVQKGIRDWPLKDYSRFHDDYSTTGKRILNNEMVAMQKREFNELLNHPMIGATAATLAQTSSIRVFGDSLFSKKPRADNDPGVIGWHADQAYWPTCTSNKMLTVWIPLQDCTIDMGPVVYVNESHKWKDDMRLRKYYNANNQSLEEMDDFLHREMPGHSRSVMTLKKGQISFHHGFTVHASYPNTSKRERMAFAVHFQDHDNHYQKAYREDGSPLVIGYDTLCRRDENGLPDYSDPNVFPTLFRLK